MARGDTLGDIDVLLALWEEGKGGESPRQRAAKGKFQPKRASFAPTEAGSALSRSAARENVTAGTGSVSQGVGGDAALPDLPPRQDPQRGDLGILYFPLNPVFYFWGSKGISRDFPGQGEKTLESILVLSSRRAASP